jgi:hypothetical protein
MTSQLILQLQDGTGEFSCEQIDHFPAPRSAYVAIAFNQSPLAEQYAIRLKRALERWLQELGAVSGKSVPPCDGGPKQFLQCGALSEPENTKLLIVVSDGSNNLFSAPGIAGWPHTVLPVIPQGAPVLLPPPLTAINAVFWKGSIDEVVPAILGLTSVSESDQRIFISYRRTDTQEFAEQLFDRLNHEGFDVFLDRFSINPGLHFQNRLGQELLDKAMVLLLESTSYQDSQWVQYEIDFAKKYRLGLLALNIDASPKVASVDDEFRLPANLNASKRLDVTALNDLVVEIRRHHANALYRKRHYLTQNILEALRKKGATPDVDSHGFVTVNGARPGTSYKIWSVARPPAVGDYRYTDITHSQGEKLIVGPAFVEVDRVTLNSWLSDKAVVRYFNEGELLQLATLVRP